MFGSRLLFDDVKNAASSDKQALNVKPKNSFSDSLASSPEGVNFILNNNPTARANGTKLLGSNTSLFHNKNRKLSLPNDCYDVVVIGAGFSGVFATHQAYKELSTARVALIDSNGLLSPESSSQNECFKMHTGLHYIKDRPTAEACLRNTVEMAHAFYDLILDKDKPNAPSRRGRHYLVNNADSPSIEEVKIECENLKRLYAELLVDFPEAAKVFGSPENFITYLEPEQYSYVSPNIPFENKKGDIENINVTLGIETPECQIDINRFKQYFENVFVYLRDRVKLFGEHTVVRVSHAEEFLGYVVETRRFDKATSKVVRDTFLTKAVINCTWQNIDGIDSDLNFQHNDYRPCTIRAKLLVKATVPSSLRAMNTCIFFAGPHVSLTRVPESATNPEERVLVTYEPKTNFGHFPSGTSPSRIEDERLKKLIARPTSPKEKEMRDQALDTLSRDIMAGAAKYVPFLSEAQIVGKGIGFVKIFSHTGKGNEYLYDPYSPIHQRREDGIQQRDLCYISFSGMKMSHSFNSAQRVVEMIHRQFIVRNVLENFIWGIMNDLCANEEGEMDYHHRSALRYSLKAHLLSELALAEMFSNIPTEDLRSQLMEWTASIDAKIHKQYYNQLKLHEEVRISSLMPK